MALMRERETADQAAMRSIAQRTREFWKRADA
jgi:hypothetical protein